MPSGSSGGANWGSTRASNAAAERSAPRRNTRTSTPLAMRAKTTTAAAIPKTSETRSGT